MLARVVQARAAHAVRGRLDFSSMLEARSPSWARFTAVFSGAFALGGAVRSGRSSPRAAAASAPPGVSTSPRSGSFGRADRGRLGVELLFLERSSGRRLRAALRPLTRQRL